MMVEAPDDLHGAYHILARRVASEIAGCTRSGVRVEGIVGVGGSPLCGVRTTRHSTCGGCWKSWPILLSLD